MHDRSHTMGDDERFAGNAVTLRPVTEADCTDAYLGWLQDPAVNQYLETRWAEQSLASITAFVQAMRADPASHLMAIVETETTRHIGNIKIGPVNPHHRCAEVSYFIGERHCWGHGYATEAIRLITTIGFERLDLHRCQAGVYAGNVGSIRALEKAGYTLEGAQRKQLRGPDGWEDHLWLGILRDEWEAGR